MDELFSLRKLYTRCNTMQIIRKNSKKKQQFSTIGALPIGSFFEGVRTGSLFVKIGDDEIMRVSDGNGDFSGAPEYPTRTIRVNEIRYGEE